MNIEKGKIIKNVSQLVLYGIIGAVSASIDFLVFNILVMVVGIYYIAANCLSVLVGIVTSFTLNRTLNFKVTDKVVARFSLFFSAGLLGLFLSNIIMWIGVERFCLSENITKIISIFVVALIQFVFNKSITFKESR